MTHRSVHSSHIGTRLALVLSLLGFLACAAEAASDSPSQKGGGGGSTGKPAGSAGSNVGTSGSSSSGVSGSASGVAGGSVGPSKPTETTSLPLVIDQFFAPCGYMADARGGNATMTPLTEMGDTTCDGARASGTPRGFCHIVTFTTFGTTPELTWGGVYWQYPGNNWGEQPGLGVEAGASKIRFKARGDKGGETVGFFAGGVGLDGGSHQPTAKNYDGFSISGDGPNTKTLTTEWADYEIDLTGQTYDKGVIGGFGWGIGAEGNTLPVKFYVDDIVWEK